MFTRKRHVTFRAQTCGLILFSLLLFAKTGTAQSGGRFTLEYYEDRIAHSELFHINEDKPSFEAPEVKGEKVFFGRLPTGSTEDENLWFAWDISEPWPKRTLYVDMNQNSKIGDDPSEILTLDIWGGSSSMDYRFIMFWLARSAEDLTYLIGLRPYMTELIDRPRFEVHFYSSWVGIIELGKKKWQFGVVDNLDGQIGPGDLFLLGAVNEEDDYFYGSVATLRFPYTNTLYLDGAVYNLGFSLTSGIESMDLVVNLKKTMRQMGSLRIEGRDISRLVLYSDDKKMPPVVVVDEPGKLVKVPVGTYTRQRVYLSGNEKCGTLLSECENRVAVSKDSTVSLKMGLPLDNSADIRRDGDVIAWRYQIKGIGEEIYYEFVEWYGRRVMTFKPFGEGGGMFQRRKSSGEGIYEFTSANPPLFTVHVGDCEIASHEVRQVTDEADLPKGQLIDRIRLSQDKPENDPYYNVIPGRLLILSNEFSDNPMVGSQFFGYKQKDSQVYDDIRVSDDLICYSHEQVPQFQYGLEESSDNTLIWQVPSDTDGNIQLIVSRDIGNLGPREGKPIAIKPGSATSREPEPVAPANGKAEPGPLPLSMFTESRLWPLLFEAEVINDPLQIDDLPKVIEHFEKTYGVMIKTDEGMARLGFESKKNHDLLKQKVAFSALPYFFYGIRNLYGKDELSDEETELAIHVSKLISEEFGEDGLKIVGRDQEALRTGLECLANWFKELCMNDQALAAMIFTMDDGPFIGEEVREEALKGAEEVGRAELMDGDGHLVLLRTAHRTSPMILSHITSDGNTSWSRRLTAGSDGIDSAEFAKRKEDNKSYTELEGFGYRIHLFADWAYGNEYGHLYLDENCRLRFYYLSW